MGGILGASSHFLGGPTVRVNVQVSNPGNRDVFWMPAEEDSRKVFTRARGMGGEIGAVAGYAGRVLPVIPNLPISPMI